MIFYWRYVPGKAAYRWPRAEPNFKNWLKINFPFVEEVSSSCVRKIYGKYPEKIELPKGGYKLTD